MVFEVLSKSTGWYDQTRKLKDYDRVSTLRQYVCISPSEVRISVWIRDVDGRLHAEEDLVDGDTSLSLIDLSASLPLAGIYEGTGLLEQT